MTPTTHDGTNLHASLAEIAQQALLSRYAPASVLITHDHQTLYFFGPTQEYIAQPTGKPTSDLLAMVNDDLLRTELGTAIRQAAATDEPASVSNARIVRRDKSYDVKISVVPLTVNGERLLLVSFQDELGCETETTLRANERQLRLQKEQLVESDRRKDEFLAALSHELRNPLASIGHSLHALKIALASPNPDRLQWGVDMIERQLGRLTHMMEDLFDMALLTHDKLELRRSRAELNALAEEAARDNRPLFESRRQTLVVTLSSAPVWVDGDATRLIQVLTNLLSNAAWYTDEGGDIALTVEQTATEAILRVRDSGVGIDSELLPHVFDMFKRGCAASGKKGLGLGLTLVRRLVELHGGRAEVHSEGLRKGSEFVVRLPLAPARASATQTGKRKHTNSGSTRRVLIVEDNPEVSDSFVTLLKMLGHDVQAAMDGPAALELAPQFKPEVAFIDIAMPDMDGYEVARRLRQELCPCPRLVAVTGHGRKQDVDAAEQAGFDRHLVKPPRLEDLLEVLEHGAAVPPA